MSWHYEEYAFFGEYAFFCRFNPAGNRPATGGVKPGKTLIKDVVMPKLRSLLGLAAICMMMLSLLAMRGVLAQGAELPISINFDEDTPGTPPLTGGEG